MADDAPKGLTPEIDPTTEWIREHPRVEPPDYAVAKAVDAWVYRRVIWISRRYTRAKRSFTFRAFLYAFVILSGARYRSERRVTRATQMLIDSRGKSLEAERILIREALRYARWPLRHNHGAYAEAVPLPDLSERTNFREIP